MIRKLVCKALNEGLGGMIEPLSPESLNVSISGKAFLENVRVRPEFVQEMGLPLSLNAGTVGSIEIDIPLAHLKSKPIVVKIKDVLISLSPNPDVNVKRVLLKKQLYEFGQLSADDADFDMNSKMGKLIVKIIDNIVIMFEDLHIRIEDTVSSQTSWNDPSRANPDQNFSLGITLDHLEIGGCVVNADGMWMPGCLKHATRFLNKRALLGSHLASDVLPEAQRRISRAKMNPSGLGLYCHTVEQPLAISDPIHWEKEMRGFIASKNWRTDNYWILTPVSATALVSIDKNPQFTSCTSRVWTDARTDVSPPVTVNLSGLIAHKATVAVTPELLVGGTVELHWEFSSGTSNTRFRVKFRSAELLPGDWRHEEVFEPSQCCPSHLRRITGYAVALRAGEIGL
eukprot:SAG11_NODE_69_length_18453_cov_37.601613_17_plen_399_part_00